MIHGDIAGAIQQFSTWLIPLVLAITLHEAAHGFAALRLGDDTALRMGRVSANPLRHVDPFGTIILPGILLLSGAPIMFGWAKPVPVNFGRLKPLRMGMVLVALAGPMTNVVLAIVSAALLYVTPYLPNVFHVWTLTNLENSVSINLVLAIFNMLPIPPLDGGRVAVGLLPRSLAIPLANSERYTMIGLMAALLILPFLHINLFGWLIGWPARMLEIALYQLLGLA
jgi:Zn-dependent protease